MSDAIGVGIIGYGLMGRTHAAAYDRARQAGAPCALRGIATRSTRPLRERSGTPPFAAADVTHFGDADALFADERIHAVSICTWTDTHVDLAVRALAAGKHVLVEKPLALRADAIRPLVHAAGEANRLCMPAMCMRFWPGWPWLRDRIREGTFGAPLGIRLTRLTGRPTWAPFYADTARSGGALFDLHIHDVDMLYWCFGDPATVNATGDLLHVHTRYTFPGRSLAAEAEGGWVDDPGFGFRMRYEAVFEEAIARFDFGRDPVLTLTRGERSEPIALPADDAYDAQVAHFIDLIAAGRLDARATLEDAIAVTAILETERANLPGEARP